MDITHGSNQHVCVSCLLILMLFKELFSAVVNNETVFVTNGE
jgi:hypothetical protein